MSRRERRPLKSEQDVSPRVDSRVGSRHHEGPEGRGLREEAGVADRGRHRRAALLSPRGSAGLLRAQTESCLGEFPFVRGSGHALANHARIGRRPAGAVRARLLARSGRDRGAGARLCAGRRRRAPGGGRGPRRRASDEAAATIEFVFAVGSTYFFEIAKLRAARLLWAQAVAAFGPANRPRLLHAHARADARASTRASTTYTNLLRVTTEAMSAVIGGCDSLTVEPFGFDAHLAANVQRILREEAHLDAVADPAGGSYYIGR